MEGVTQRQRKALNRGSLGIARLHALSRNYSVGIQRKGAKRQRRRVGKTLREGGERSSQTISKRCLTQAATKTFHPHGAFAPLRLCVKSLVQSYGFMPRPEKWGACADGLPHFRLPPLGVHPISECDMNGRLNCCFMKASMRNRAKGTAKEIKGRVKEIAGHATRSKRLAREGRVEAKRGQVRRKVGEVQKDLEEDLEA